MIDLGTCIKIQFKILNFLCNKFTIQPIQCITNVASHLSIPAIATFKKIYCRKLVTQLNNTSELKKVISVVVLEC